MEKTLKIHIEELLHLYDEARTTDAQERELADFFSQPHDDLPEEWEKYAILFTAFSHCDSLFSEAELEEMTTLLPHRSRRVWPWTLGAAATIALLIGFFLHQPQPTESSDYLAIAEQPIQGVEELVITTVDSALMGRIAGLDIAYTPETTMPTTGTHTEKVERIAKVEEKEAIVPTTTIAPAKKQIMIGSVQVTNSHEAMAFNSPTLDASKVYDRAKDKQIIMEISLKEEDYLAESEIISDFDKASQEGLMEFLRSGGSLQKGFMGFGNSDKALQEGPMEFCGLDESLQEEAITIGEDSLDDWVIAEQPIQAIEELGITTVDSALMGRIAGLDISTDYKESSQKKRMKFTGAQKSRPTYHVSVDGELPPSSMNRLLTLTKNEIRKYSQSQGEEIEDFDVLITNGEKVW
ncbi:MAG: hypothetical protein IKY31_02365 [Bacteroidaceae bacterium]|nr:hypothetical protein [Bacteroidaceae bacterium]